MRLILAVLLLLLGGGVLAQPSIYHYSLTPASPRAGEEVFLRVDSDNGCYPANSFEVSRNGDLVNVKNTLNDVSPCEPQWATPRNVSLGVFQGGSYQVTVETCVNSPVDPCSVWATLGLAVFEESGSHTIPTFSHLGAVLAALSMLFGAWVTSRRR